MYRVEAKGVIDATPQEAWAVQVDVAGWPAWNSHEMASRIDGPFEVGTRGWSKPRGGPGADWELVEVDAPHLWRSRSALPGGALTGWRRFTRTADGRLECDYGMEATGPLQVLFRWWFGPRIRRDMLLSFGELEAEVERRRAMAP